MASLPRIPRDFRLSTKKRGERRTGSQRVGNAGLTLFSGGMLVAGVCFFGILFVLLAWPEWKVNQQFEKVDNGCLIIARECWKVEMPGGGQTDFRPTFTVEYSVNNARFEREITEDITGTCYHDKPRCQSVLNQYKIGERCDCWHDRDDLGTVVLVRGYTGYVWLILFLPGAFILLGASGLVYRIATSRMSAEHRKALARRAAEMTSADVTLAAGTFPSVPHDSGMSDSPGTWLAFRLPAHVSSGWALLAMFLGCLAFCGLASVFITLSAANAVEGRFDGLLLIVSVISAPLAIWLLYLCLKQLIHQMHLGRTVVEVSRYRLHPGANCRVFLAQFGRLKMKRFRLSLACVEKATYQQGTNTRAESRQVVDVEIQSWRNVAVTPDEPFELELDFQIPAGAMHSFKASRNEIAWMLVVEATLAPGSDFRRSFPLIVYPIPYEEATEQRKAIPPRRQDKSEQRGETVQGESP